MQEGGSLSRQPVFRVLFLLSLLASTLLFSVKMGWLLKPPEVPRDEAVAQAEKMAGTMTWMNIFQKGKKIGYARRQFAKRPEGGYTAGELVFMKLSSMGLVQEITVSTTGVLNPDLTLKRFTFNLQSPGLAFSARGEMKGNTLFLTTGKEPDLRTMTIPLKERPYLGAGLMQAASLAYLAPGQSRTFPVFDPATMSEQSARVTVRKIENITILGEKVRARKVKVEFGGNAQTAWVGKDGEVLVEEGLLGIRMEKATVEQVFAGGFDEGSSSDLVEISSINPGGIIKDPEKAVSLKLEVTAPAQALANIETENQEFAGVVLTITQQALPVDYTRADAPGKVFDGGATYLESDSFISANDPKIREQALKIASRDEPALVRARKVIAWVHENLEKRPVFSIPSAVDILETRAGDCNEHSVLTAALARALGVPTRVEVGVVYQRGRFYYHAWNSFYVRGRWISADAVFGQFPADVTHVSFSRGQAARQGDMIGLLGQLGLKLVEQRY